MFFLDRPKRKPMKDHTDEELYFMMEHNESIDMKELAVYCSEILRRLLEKEKRAGNSIGRAEVGGIQ